MDGLELLMQDHQKVKQLFQKIEIGGSGVQPQTLFDQIYHELTIHTVIEEQVFYPALAKFPEMESLLKDAYKEHAEAKLELGRIANIPSDSAEWKHQVTKLNKDIDHHVQDEEQKMFPKVRKLMNEQQLEELGQALQQAKTSKLDSQVLSQPGPMTVDGQSQQFA